MPAGVPITLYDALDWPYRGQARIAKELAAPHLGEGDRVLWNVTKLRFESHTCKVT